jgi:hypothetical protein
VILKFSRHFSKSFTGSFPSSVLQFENALKLCEIIFRVPPGEEKVHIIFRIIRKWHALYRSHWKCQGHYFVSPHTSPQVRFPILVIGKSVHYQITNVTWIRTVILSSTTDKMQRYTIFFIIVNISGICHACLLLPLAWHIPDAVCTVFELLMMGGETACNM